MSPIYVPGKVVLKKESVPFDYDAWQYIAAVEAADGEILEQPVRDAITNFVSGCKTDGIWAAIKACCIMNDARTLAGALVPIKGNTPTNDGFLSADYDRKLGLLGNGTSKRIDTGYTGEALPTNAGHLSAFITQASPNAGADREGFLANGNSEELLLINTSFFGRIHNTGTSAASVTPSVGFVGASRPNASSVNWRYPGQSGTQSATASTPSTANLYAFSRGSSDYSASRQSFYSLGESLDLALLDARVSTLMSDLAAAIP